MFLVSLECNSCLRHYLGYSDCPWGFGVFVPVAQPCNPAVGGPAKSQLVHEVDALGGEIGKMADRYVLSLPLLCYFALCHGRGSVPAILEDGIGIDPL